MKSPPQWRDKYDPGTKKPLKDASLPSIARYLVMDNTRWHPVADDSQLIALYLDDMPINVTNLNDLMTQVGLILFKSERRIPIRAATDKEPRRIVVGKEILAAAQERTAVFDSEPKDIALKPASCWYIT